MTTLHIEFLGQVPLYIAMGIKILTAMFLGGLIGLDREQKMKSAGIKTNMLICIGACVYTALSLMAMKHAPAATVMDPNRTAAQIVSGIGFLGAGAIIQGRGNVIGLTTAATIWVVAAIGMTIGFGYPMVATIITLTILIVLRLISPIYKMLESEKHFKDYHIEILSQGKVKNPVKEILYSKVDDIDDIIEEIIDQENDRRLLHVYLRTHPRRVPDMKDELRQLIRVDKIQIHQRDKMID